MFFDVENPLVAPPWYSNPIWAKETYYCVGLFIYTPFSRFYTETRWYFVTFHETAWDCSTCSAALIFVTNNQIAHLLRAEYRFENSAKTVGVRIISCAGEPTNHAFQTNESNFFQNFTCTRFALLLLLEHQRFTQNKNHGFRDIFTPNTTKKTDQAKVFPSTVALVRLPSFHNFLWKSDMLLKRKRPENKIVHKKPYALVVFC